MERVRSDSGDDPPGFFSKPNAIEGENHSQNCTENAHSASTRFRVHPQNRPCPEPQREKGREKDEQEMEVLQGHVNLCRSFRNGSPETGANRVKCLANRIRMGKKDEQHQAEEETESKQQDFVNQSPLMIKMHEDQGDHR